MDPGTLVAGRFRIEAVAGRGAFATVYRAHDRETDSTVALKLLRDVEAFNRTHFEREARLLSRFHHPRIVRFVGYGDSDDGYFLALEWLEGESLLQRLKRSVLSVPEAVALVRGIADALGAAHAAGVVHRDVKPGNIFLVGGDPRDARLLDFGIARLMQASARITATGQLVGTPGYMAPEQVRGDAHVDARADVFSLGCLLFRAITGVPPFHGNHVTAVLAKVLLEAPPRLRERCPDAPLALDRFVNELLSKKPDDRPADGAEVARRLDMLGEVRGPDTSQNLPALTLEEQRLVSVVLAETPVVSEDGIAVEWGSVRGTDDLPTELDSHAAAELARATQPIEQLRAALGPLGAEVERLIDGVLVATLSRQLATDRAANALRAARIVHERLGVRVVLATGRARLGEQLPVGEVIDRAVGMLRGGGDSPIALDDLTARLLGVNADAEPPSLLGRKSPCVGRDRELRSLESLYEECIAERSARVALITGEPGIGKTRIALELAARLSKKDSAIWNARADSMSQGSLYGVAAQLVDRATGPVPDILDFARAADDLEDPIVRAERVKRAFVDLLRAECRARPLVVILEDFHWCDHASLRLLDGALRALDDTPLLVVAFGRPETVDAFPKLWSGVGIVHLVLRELGKKASEQLVREMLPAVDDATLRFVCERAAGNALFLEELIRGVAEGRGRDVPPTVVAMVEHRLDRLEPEARQVLRAASIFGSELSRDGLQALLAGTEAAKKLDSILDDLAAAEMLQGKWRFRHDVLREACYATLLPDDRALGHRLAAAWLESTGFSDAATIAEHWERAGEKTRAAPFWGRAAVVALRASDLGAAIERATRAIENGAASGEAWLVLAEAHLFRGEHDRVGECARNALAALEPRSRRWFVALGEIAVDAVRHGTVDAPAVEALAKPAKGAAENARLAAAARVSIHLSIAGKMLDADRLLASIDGEPTDPTTLAAVLHARGVRALQEGDLVVCLREHERAAELFEKAEDFRRACNAQTNIGFSCMALGAYEQAEKALAASLARAESMGLTQVAAMVRHNLGFVLAQIGQGDRAVEMEKSAADLFAAQKDVRMHGGAILYLARIHLARGDARSACDAAREAVRILGDIPTLRCYALGALALAELDLGNVGAARTAAAEAVGLLDGLGAIEEGEILIRLADAETLQRSGSSDAARRTIKKVCDEIRSRAARIADPAYARSFVERVPEHVRALALEHAL